jgi:hypothetical protein
MEVYKHYRTNNVMYLTIKGLNKFCENNTEYNPYNDNEDRYLLRRVSNDNEDDIIQIL